MAGDYVLAYNETTGEVGYYPITGVWGHQDPVIVYLTLDGEIIETTPEHPFYTTEGEWVAAGDLQVGDEIRQADGSYGLVEPITFVEQPQWMYNFTVATAHTYLTTCRVPCYQMGIQAMRLLLNRINGSFKEGKEVVLQPKLVIRASAPDIK